MVRAIILRYNERQFSKIEKMKNSISGASWERFVYQLVTEKMESEKNG